MKKSLVALVVLFCCLMAAVFSCMKATRPTLPADNTTTVLYKTASAPSMKREDLFLGGNMKQVDKIEYSNSALADIVSSDAWRELDQNIRIDKSQITKAQYFSTGIEVITIPYSLNDGSEHFFNIYTNKGKFLITRVEISRLANGNRLLAVKSADNSILHYQFEINNQNRIGHWKFDKSISFGELTAVAGPKIKTNSADEGGDDEIGGCSSKPFNECMNCMIVKICGSDWACIIACGLFPIPCVAGAGLACVTG